MKFDINFYKVENLTPDEQNYRRKNQQGVWLATGLSIEAPSARKAITLARREEHFSGKGNRLRAVAR